MSQTLSERLKTETRPYHDSAEGNQFQGLLVKGELDKASYAQYLAQLYVVHKELEHLIDQSGDKRLHGAVTKPQYQEDFLSKDLSVLGIALDSIRPLDSTKKLVETIRKTASDSPAGLLGYHYVLFGSKHGGKYIAKMIRDRYQFTTEGGTCYFDPYGDGFQPHWKSFVSGMNDAGWSKSEHDRIVESAKEMFVGVSAIGSEMLHGIGVKTS